jgi:hypothetical protein
MEFRPLASAGVSWPRRPHRIRAGSLTIQADLEWIADVAPTAADRQHGGRANGSCAVPWERARASVL